MESELDALAVALYVKIDDERDGLLRLPGRPPVLSHSELICLAVMQSMLGFHSEARWLRYARAHLRHLFPFLPQQPGYNKRLRAALPQIKTVIRMLARDTDFWQDTVWLADSTPVPCGASRPTARRSELADWANPWHGWLGDKCRTWPRSGPVISAVASKRSRPEPSRSAGPDCGSPVSHAFEDCASPSTGRERP